MNNRSKNLVPLSLDDVFDTSSKHSVINISQEIDYIIQKAIDEGTSANTLFVIFHFYAQNMMVDIQYGTERELKERELKEEESKKEDVRKNLSEGAPDEPSN